MIVHDIKYELKFGFKNKGITIELLLTYTL